MAKKTDAIFTYVQQLFGELSKSEQVDLMTTLYYSMLDGQKDEFLRETENA
jgi:hypothetical protein